MNRRGPLIASLALVALVPLAACSRGKENGSAASTPPPATATADVAGALDTPTPIVPPLGSVTPGPAQPGVTPTPGGPPPTTTPRIVDGLQVVDEMWVGIVREPGGLRLRSAPRVEPGNVVGSVAQETPVNVEGRVLNGQEAEPGKGTVWLIVGPSQYLYAAPGYVERVR
jgi:hypothetical protein